MPLVKRNIEPRHLCRGTVPDGITSELECVTNNTLAAIIRQLSSLSKHAEDIFGELFNEANTFYIRANSLQDRIDRLAVKVTQLDSTVEEVSLQDINMRKAFKSSTIQDQQVVSKNSIPHPITDIYNTCDKPPPLNILSPYRDDRKDGLKIYTDPSYFFDLWKEKMLQDTEDKRKEKRRQKEQKRVDGTTREVKKVRKARNRRQEWNIMAYDKELRPDSRLSPNVYQAASSEGSMSPDTRSHVSDLTEYSYPATPNHSGHQHPMTPTYVGSGESLHHIGANQVHEHDFRSSTGTLRHGTLSRPQQPPPPPPPSSMMDGPPPLPSTECRRVLPSQMMEYYPTGSPPPPPPVIPSAQTAFVSPLQHPVPGSPGGQLSGSPYAPSPPPGGVSISAATGPPPPPPGPPLSVLSLSSSPMHFAKVLEAKRLDGAHLLGLTSDARSDLLSAIRMGIQLKKVQEQREQEAKREPVGNDVATILSRRIAVEYSDSEDDSEFDENDWSD
ncbi:actin-binding protein WASF3 [Hyla sarda]|uniref:actin-binding protein WASF3 n=1 Tax=Hyla sarda TaxID=327740 RepID=UPI0024C22EDE|nr:actin-binding protein WASF3 [Hyla sarda]XP_056417766.1 actin-binding protein WASF3 [Hyla sarda]XP_056417767.1 actin-binding protein WASF3 [Hyla sarda]XP_056417768.1 actin-binding protein WASF3 [Hyla sarda]